MAKLFVGAKTWSEIIQILQSYFPRFGELCRFTDFSNGRHKLTFELFVPFLFVQKSKPNLWRGMP